MESSEMRRETLEAHRPGRGLLNLTLARPDRGNAINAAMIRELSTELKAAETDPTIRLVAIQGSGKHFCGGADIGGAKEPADAATPPLPELLLQLDRLSKPTVVFVQGACIGAALALVACCDVAIASADAFFSMPEVRLGMVPGLLPFFVKATGYRAFRRYGLSGERFSAHAAMTCGLVSEIVEKEAWPERQAHLLDAFLHAAPETLGIIKREALRYADVGIALDDFQGRRRESSESAEGKASFKEKRKPHWYIEP